MQTMVGRGRTVLGAGLLLLAFVPTSCSSEAGSDEPSLDDGGTLDSAATDDSSSGSDTSDPSTDGTVVADAGADAKVDSTVIATSTHFVVYGDSRSNPGPHQTVVDAFAKRNPQMVLATGDLWDGYGPAQWKTIVTKNANIADLLAKNLFIVSRGNHETITEVKAFAPTILRDNTELYSFTFGNSFFVSLGMDPAGDAAYLKTQLSSAAAKAASWRFVYSHYPIYSAGPHGGDGIASIEALCDEFGVTAYFTGHDHLYERSHQMKGQKVVDTGNALTTSKGVVYIVTGGGGAPLYAAGKIASTHFTKSTLHFVDVTASATSVSVEAITPDGKTLDSFTIAK